MKTLDPGVKAELDSESEDEVLMATSTPLKEELLSSDLNSDDQADIGNDRDLAHAVYFCTFFYKFLISTTCSHD